MSSTSLSTLLPIPGLEMSPKPDSDLLCSSHRIVKPKEEVRQGGPRAPSSSDTLRRGSYSTEDVSALRARVLVPNRGEQSADGLRSRDRFSDGNHCVGTIRSRVIKTGHCATSGACSSLFAGCYSSSVGQSFGA